MKFQFLYIVLAGFFIAGISYNFQGGPAAAGGSDFTASPRAQGAFCSTCHVSGAFAPSLEIKLMENGAPVDKYKPGTTYQLEITIASMDMPIGFGFQATAMDAASNSLGTFGNLPADVQISELAGVNYVEHAKRLDGNVLTVDWTAPAAGGGALNIFAAGIAANGDNGTAGDGAANASLIVQEDGNSSTEGIGNLKLDIALLSNPVNDVLPIRIASSKGMNLKARLVNLSGNRVLEQDLQIMQGDQVISMEVGDLERGIYFLQLTDGQSVKTEKVLKM